MALYQALYKILFYFPTKLFVESNQTMYVCIGVSPGGTLLQGAHLLSCQTTHLGVIAAVCGRTAFAACAASNKIIWLTNIFGPLVENRGT